MNYTWSELIEKAKSNDQEAFYELYQNSYDAVYRAVKSMVKDEDVALDIVQDAFVKGFANLSTLENPDNFLPWMKRIATNKARDWFKKKREISFSQMSDDEDYILDFEDDRVEHMPDEVIDRNETARLIDEILSTLSDEQRIAIGMFYYQDMSVAEIAQELEISENTVKSRLNYGRKKIKAGVEELEKKGTKLYGLAPIPFLLWLFKTMQAQAAVSNAPAAVFGEIMAETTAQASATAASGAVSSTVSATGSAGATAANAGTVAAGKAAGGLLSSIGAKIIAGVVAVSLVAGGVAVGTQLMNRGDNNDVPVAGVTDTETEEENSNASFEEFNNVFVINAYRGATYMIISEDGEYQLHSFYSNNAFDKQMEYFETGEFGKLKQLEDGSFTAEVLMAVAPDKRNTSFTEGSIVHFYPVGTSANVLGDDVWIGYDKVSFSEEEYIYNLENGELLDENDNFNQYVIWQEGDNASFIATDTPNDDARYFDNATFFDWETITGMKTALQGNNYRIEFSGTAGAYYYDWNRNELVAVPEEDLDWVYDAYKLIVLDTPQIMELYSPADRSLKSVEVQYIDISGADNLYEIEDYYGQLLTYSINPYCTYWADYDGEMFIDSMPPYTSDIFISE